MLSYNPYRIVDDPSFLRMIETYSTRDRAIYLMAHFLHPRELTHQAEQAADMIRKAGALICNQSP
jgi:lysine 2,3-aminomutase